MNLEILRSTAPRFKYYRRIESDPGNNKPSSTLKFFYIGKNFERVNSLLSVFETGQCAENYDSAKLLLKKSKEIQSIIPGFIILDLPYECRNTSDFLLFLKNSHSFRQIPVIYSANSLSISNIQALRKEKLVDEILDISKCGHCLANKIHLLNRVKGYGNGSPLKKVTIESGEGLIDKPGSIFKRIFDILVSSILLLVSLPVFALIALAIKLESRGPVFYAAYRAGRGYRIFKFFKFRTMEVGADLKINDLAELNQYKSNEEPVFFKADNDPRVTRIGTFLRNCSLDELPQLINVLLGDMSLVGNRPLPLYEAAALTTDQWAERFMAPAGITGLWQIKKRGQKNMSALERINLDIAYAHQSNFMYDLWIIANTPSALMQKSNV
jgi:lipopolysaccharide/colanic/teichoic acid biosynthesis glycosyltransferase